MTRPSVLLLHGYSCSAAHWGSTLALLGDRWSLDAPDLPGHGSAAAPTDEPLDMAYCVRFVEGRARALGRPLLVGHSMGGMIALLAGRDPAVAAGIVLVDAYPHLGLPPPFNRSFWSGTPTDLRQEITQGMLQTRHRLPVSLWRSVGGLRVPVDEVAVPVRGIYGDRGDSDHDALRQALLATDLGRLPGFEVRFIRGSGHFPMLECPGAFAEALDEALEGLVA